MMTFDPPLVADDFRIGLRPGMKVERHGERLLVRDDGTLEPADPDAARPPPSPAERVATTARWVGGWPGLAGLAVAVRVAVRETVSVGVAVAVEAGLRVGVAEAVQLRVPVGLAVGLLG